MKIFTLTLICAFLASCTNMIAGDMAFTDLVFLSKDKNVNIVELKGLDLGPLYRKKNLDTRNIGKATYVSTDGIKVSETMVIRWKYSDAGPDGKVMEAVIRRDKHDIPDIINNDGDSLVLVFSKGNWSAQYRKKSAPFSNQ